MATITAHYHHSNQNGSNGKTHVTALTITNWFSADWSEHSPMAFVLGMAGYF